MKLTGFFVVFLCLVFSLPVPADQPARLQPADELELVSVGAPSVSPDGKWVAYSVSRYCSKKEEREGTSFWCPSRAELPVS